MSVLSLKHALQVRNAHFHGLNRHACWALCPVLSRHRLLYPSVQLYVVWGCQHFCPRGAGFIRVVLLVFLCPHFFWVVIVESKSGQAQLCPVP